MVTLQEAKESVLKSKQTLEENRKSIEESQKNIDKARSELVPIANRSIPQRKFGSGVSRDVQQKFIESREVARKELRNVEESQKEVDIAREQYSSDVSSVEESERSIANAEYQMNKVSRGSRGQRGGVRDRSSIISSSRPVAKPIVSSSRVGGSPVLGVTSTQNFSVPKISEKNYTSINEEPYPVASSIKGKDSVILNTGEIITPVASTGGFESEYYKQSLAIGEEVSVEVERKKEVIKNKDTVGPFKLTPLGQKTVIVGKTVAKGTPEVAKIIVETGKSAGRGLYKVNTLAALEIINPGTIKNRSLRNLVTIKNAQDAEDRINTEFSLGFLGASRALPLTTELIGAGIFSYQSYKTIKEPSKENIAYLIIAGIGSKNFINKGISRSLGLYKPEIITTSKYPIEPRVVSTERIIKKQGESIKALSASGTRQPIQFVSIVTDKRGPSGETPLAFGVPSTSTYKNIEIFRSGEVFLEPRSPTYYKKNIPAFYKDLNIKLKAVLNKEPIPSSKALPLKLTQLGIPEFNIVESKVIVPEITYKNPKKFFSRVERPGEFIATLSPKTINKYPQPELELALVGNQEAASSYKRTFIGYDKQGVSIFRRVPNDTPYSEVLKIKFDEIIKSYKSQFFERDIYAYDVAQTGLVKERLLQKGSSSGEIIDNSGTFHLQRINIIAKQLREEYGISISDKEINAFARTHDISKQPVYNYEIPKSLERALNRGFLNEVEDVSFLTSEQKSMIGKAIRYDERPPINIRNLVVRTQQTLKNPFVVFSPQQKLLINADRLARFGDNADVSMIYDLSKYSFKSSKSVATLVDSQKRISLAELENNLMRAEAIKYSDEYLYGKRPYKINYPTSYKSEYKINYPTNYPTSYKSEYKINYPTNYPTSYKSEYKINYPTNYPTSYKSEYKINYPTNYPTSYKSEYKINYPTNYPTSYKSEYKINYPSIPPTNYTSNLPPDYPIINKRRLARNNNEFNKKNYSYDVFVRSGLPNKKGSYRNLRVGSRLPYNVAFSKGASIVDEYTNRSFYLRRVGITKKADIPYSTLNYKFTKIKGKSSRLNRDSFVEKPGFSIDSINELRGIPYKASLLRRQKKNKLKY